MRVNIYRVGKIGWFILYPTEYINFCSFRSNGICQPHPARSLHCVRTLGLLPHHHIVNIRRSLCTATPQTTPQYRSFEISTPRLWNSAWNRICHAQNKYISVSTHFREFPSLWECASAKQTNDIKETPPAIRVYYHPFGILGAQATAAHIRHINLRHKSSSWLLDAMNIQQNV